MGVLSIALSFFSVWLKGHDFSPLGLIATSLFHFGFVAVVFSFGVKWLLNRGLEDEPRPKLTFSRACVLGFPMLVVCALVGIMSYEIESIGEVLGVTRGSTGFQFHFGMVAGSLWAKLRHKVRTPQPPAN